MSESLGGSCPDDWLFCYIMRRTENVSPADGRSRGVAAGRY
jgi:hypothetical protein